MLPLGNGASGIFVAAMADISGNFIAFNQQFGIGVVRGNGFWVDIHPNAIFGNGNMGIDVDLDGPGEEVLHILSARYDAASDTTVITLTGTDKISTFGPTL